MGDTLAKVARLYELVAEMRDIISGLRAMNVVVRVGRQSVMGGDDYGFGNGQAALHIELLPGADRVASHLEK